MDRQQMERCLAQVAAYRSSGQGAAQWAAANGMKPRLLASWCAHARRWQAKLEGVAFEPAGGGKVAGGFVAASLPARAGLHASQWVRVELHAGGTRVELHWPLAHTRELALWLREVGR